MGMAIGPTGQYAMRCGLCAGGAYGLLPRCMQRGYFGGHGYWPSANTPCDVRNLSFTNSRTIMLPFVPIITGAVSATILIRRGLRKKSESELHLKLIKAAKHKGISVDSNGNFNPDSRINGIPLLFIFMSDIPLMTRLLEYGASPDICSADGVPALIYVTKQPKAENIIPILLKYGANPNAMDSEGKTAIFHAKSSKVLKQLQKAGADINAVDIKGNSALFYSIPNKTTKDLVNMGIDVNAKDHEGKTILFYITSADKFPLLRFLETKGLKVVETDDEGHKFVLFNKYKQFLNNININNELYKAVNDNNIDAARQALECGADPDTRSEVVERWCMLDLAIYHHNPQLIKLLVEYGANIDLDCGICTPLEHAVYDDDESCFEQLLQLGAKPENAESAVKYNGSPGIKCIFKKYYKMEL